MTVKPELESSNSLFDKFKLLLAVAIVIASVVGYYWFAQYPAIYRWLGLLAALGLAFVVAYTTPKGKSAWNFLLTSRIELRKVVWPTKPETVQTTIAVLVVVVVLGLFMWGLDAVLLWATEKLTGAGA